ncbi:hypothetical protein Psfp_02360 [Pelotomaculum sp. FP]|uniref:hypothetical protein n=1 Tax=Pelotomaculum sp. FP TaxID=261474 RepID=UPI001100AA5F|nr:hypothetical protein [Pelotomaculum sp. FP]TEB15184.1 hypothetical protein Psfp_02360 [Pelotomaculum sp. FP]
MEVIKLGLPPVNKRIRVDWPSVTKQNKGLFVVEKDYQFPGGFYVRHKNTPYYLTGSRHDIELMIENALAALEMNTGPIILATEEEAEIMAAMTRPVMELLDTQLLGTKGWYQNLLWGILNSVTVHPRAMSIRINGG